MTGDELSLLSRELEALARSHGVELADYERDDLAATVAVYFDATRRLRDIEDGVYNREPDAL